MAFCSKLSGLVRSNMFGPASALVNSARYMSTKLFVGGLSFGTDDQSLKEAFDSFGNVVEARVINDRDTGKSRGFGFVGYDNEESASKALSDMDGKEVQGRNIRVSYANERQGGGGGGGGGGGYRGGNSSYGGGGGYGGF